ncbi:MAG TPA: alpha-E domain-containing protein, partial [Terriglobales bacterium]|nr:alpha-E domain-containing protein [Terriglobales bacterium]
MLARIADSLFWLARYIERAEDTARILDVTFHTLLERGQQAYAVRWEPILSMAGEAALFRRLYGEANAQNVFEFLEFSPNNPSSIVQCVTKARENARTIRDRISREMWEDLNGLYFTLGDFDPKEETAAGPHRFCARVIFGSHRFHGVTDATLPHDEGWEFLRVGWALERAEM